MSLAQLQELRKRVANAVCTNSGIPYDEGGSAALSVIIGFIKEVETAQAPSLPPSRADLGGDRFRDLVANWNLMAKLVVERPTSTLETRAQATGWKQCADELEQALAEGQQSSELVEKTPSASPGSKQDRRCDCGHLKSEHSVNDACITFCKVEDCDCDMWRIEIGRLRRELEAEVAHPSSRDTEGE